MARVPGGHGVETLAVLRKEVLGTGQVHVHKLLVHHMSSCVPLNPVSECLPPTVAPEIQWNPVITTRIYPKTTNAVHQNLMTKRDVAADYHYSCFNRADEFHQR